MSETVDESTLLFIYCSSCNSITDDDCEKTVSVTVNGEESMIEFVDAEVEMVCTTFTLFGDRSIFTE